MLNSITVFCGTAKATWLVKTSLTLFLVAFVSSVNAHPLDDLQPGEWYEVPNSHLESVDPCPANDCPYSGVEGLNAVMDDWCGAAFDTKRERLTLMCGGHQGYAGNEVYSFDVNTMRWLRLTEPSSMSGFSEGAATMPDGRPKSVHTYDGIEYIPEPIDAVFLTMGSAWNQGGISRTTWLFDLKTEQWQRQQDAPGEIYNGFIGFGITTDYDPLTGRLLAWGDYRTADFLSATNEWRFHAADNQYQDIARNGAFDTNRRLFVSVGQSKENVIPVDSNGEMGVWQPLGSSGGSAITGAYAPGFDYDPVSDRFVGWSGGQTVYSLDMDTRTWQEHPATNGVNPGPQNANGTYSRFAYMPGRNAFLVVNATNKNVFFYKLSPGQPVQRTIPRSPLVDDS